MAIQKVFIVRAGLMGGYCSDLRSGSAPGVYERYQSRNPRSGFKEYWVPLKISNSYYQFIPI
jgi:hypothetical protein